MSGGGIKGNVSPPPPTKGEPSEQCRKFVHSFLTRHGVQIVPTAFVNDLADCIDSARVEAIRECIRVAQDYIDKRQPELSAGEIPATYTTAGAIVVRDRMHMLLATPAREKDGGV